MIQSCHTHNFDYNKNKLSACKDVEKLKYRMLLLGMLGDASALGSSLDVFRMLNAKLMHN